MSRGYLKKFAAILLIAIMVFQTFPSEAILFNFNPVEGNLSEEPSTRPSTSRPSTSSGKESRTIINTGDGHTSQSGRTSSSAPSNSIIDTSNGTVIREDGSNASTSDQASEEDKTIAEDKSQVKPEDKIIKDTVSARLVIEIVDQDKKAVNGLHFTMTNKADNKKVYDGISMDGKLVIDNLAKGDYTLESTGRLDGYQTKPFKYSVKVDDYGHVDVYKYDSNDRIATSTTSYTGTSPVIQGDTIVEASMLSLEMVKEAKPANTGASLVKIDPLKSEVRPGDIVTSDLDKEDSDILDEFAADMRRFEEANTTRLGADALTPMSAVAPMAFMAMTSTEPEFASRAYRSRAGNTGIGNLTIIKKDSEGRLLTGAVFKLKSTDNSNERILGENQTTSEFKFKNIQPGSYLLTEEKAPLGYKKSEKQWSVVVDTAGNIFIKEADAKPEIPSEGEIYTGQDIGSSLSVSGESIQVLDDKGQPKDGDINGETDIIKYALDINIPKDAKAGDYFYLSLSDTLTHDQLNPYSEVRRIIRDQDGNPIAYEEQTKEVQKINSIVPQGRIKYTLLQSGASAKHLSIRHEHRVRREVAKNNQAYSFSYKLGEKDVSDSGKITNRQVFYPKFDEAYANYYSELRLNAAARFYNTDDLKRSYGQYFYINPMGKDYGTDGVQLDIIPITYAPQFPTTAATINQENTKIKVYKVTNKSDYSFINSSISPDLSGGKAGIQDITDQVKPVIVNGKASLKIKGIGTNSYIVDVQSKMDGDTPSSALLQAGTLTALNSDGDPMPRGSLRLTSGISVGGATSSGTSGADRKNISMDVINYPEEKKKGEFIIYKTDEKNKPLGGAEFTLTRTKPSNLVLPSQGSDEKTGEIFFKDLEPGEYKLEETKAPKDHMKSEKTWTVEVDKSGKTRITEDSPKSPASDPTVGEAENPMKKSFSLFDKEGENKGILTSNDITIENPVPIEQDGYRLSQRVEKTSDPNVYKVIGKVEDLNEEPLEVVILLDESSWIFGDPGKFYADRVKEIINGINNSKASYTVIGYNSLANTIIERFKTDQAISNIHAISFTKANTKKGLVNAMNKAYEVFKTSTAPKKMLLQITGRSVYDTNVKDKSWDYNEIIQPLSKSDSDFYKMKQLGVDMNLIIEKDISNINGFWSHLVATQKKHSYGVLDWDYIVALVQSKNYKNSVNGSSHNYDYNDKVEIKDGNGKVIGTKKLGVLIDENYQTEISKFAEKAKDKIELDLSASQGLKLNPIPGDKEELGYNRSYEFKYYLTVNEIAKLRDPYPIESTDKATATVKYVKPGTQGKGIVEKTLTLPIPKISVAKININFEKIWEDTEEKEKTPIKVNLRAETEDGGTIDISSLGISKTSETISSKTSWQGSFTNLPQITSDGKKIKYRLEEDKSDLVDLKADFRVGYYYDSDTNKAFITNTKIPSITVANRKNQFEFKKVGEKGQGLAGAKFKLVCTNSSEYDEEITFYAESKKDDPDKGKVVFKDLKAGAYELYEEEAPEGYQKIEGKLADIIVGDSEAPGIGVVPVRGIPFITIGSGTNKEYRFENRKKPVKLPDAGGPGSAIFTLAGLAIMLATYILYRRRFEY